MNISSLARITTASALCLFLVVPGFSQTSGGYGHIGPSNGEIIGIAVGAGAAVAVGGYLIYRETHKHSSITGCVVSEATGLSLKNEKDKKLYALSGDLAALKAGEQVTLNGKKAKDSAGQPTFRVEKVTQDLGACHP